MTAIEEFKAKIKAGEVFDALTLAMSEAIELKITTWVSSSEMDFPEDEPQPGYRLRTSINLVDGKVENEIGSEFIGNSDYEAIQKLHLEQVKQGREILLKNLESLQKMFVVLTETLSELPKTPFPRLQSEQPAALSPSQTE
jgi:hypothetical protein